MRILNILFLALFLFAPAAFAADDTCKGVPLDDKEYYRIHSEQGERAAQFELAQIYLLKRTPEYDKKAAELFRKAADQGYSRAYTALGDGYFCGAYGTPQDRTEAVFWYTLANADSPHPTLSTSKLCTASQKAQIEERIKQWRSTHNDVREAEQTGFHNFDAILCGGESNGCKLAAICGDLLALSCDFNYEGFLFIDKNTKQKTVICRVHQGKKQCEGVHSLNGDYKDWTCDWPKPLEKKPLLTAKECRKTPDDLEYEHILAEKGVENRPGDFNPLSINVKGLACNKSQKGRITEVCGDLVRIIPIADPMDEFSYFANIRTDKIVGKFIRNTLFEDIEIPKDWTCDWPPYHPDPPVFH